MMNVEAILKEKGTEIVSASPDDSIKSVAGLLTSKKIGAALVVDAAGKVAGVISERDIVRGIARTGEKCLDLAVRDLMTEDVVTCKLGDHLDQIMSLMTARRVRHLPVMNGEELLGIISIGDVVKYRIGEIEQEAQALREYITA